MPGCLFDRATLLKCSSEVAHIRLGPWPPVVDVRQTKSETGCRHGMLLRKADNAQEAKTVTAGESGVMLAIHIPA